MSSLRVNKLVNANDDGPIEFSKGLTIPQNYPLQTQKLVINSTGIVTATSFSGNGSQLTGLTGLSTKKAIALSFII